MKNKLLTIQQMPQDTSHEQTSVIKATFYVVYFIAAGK